MEKVTMELAAWSAEVEALLAGAAGDDSTYTLADMAREVVDPSNSSQLFLFRLGGRKIGYAVLFVEDFGSTRELVLQAGEAFISWPEAAAHALRAIESYALRMGCATMRSHVQKGGRLGAMKRAGFRQSEIVVRKRVGR